MVSLLTCALNFIHLLIMVLQYASHHKLKCLQNIYGEVGVILFAKASDHDEGGAAVPQW